MVGFISIQSLYPDLATSHHSIDATAGLGRDAFLLAGLGAQVTLIERSPQVRAALQTGLDAARLDEAAAPVVARMTLLAGDSIALLEGLSADVVLVDPMHPPRGNTALVKQDVVMKDGTTYVMTDSLYREWVARKTF